jgi:protein-disulfide isomerase
VPGYVFALSTAGLAIALYLGYVSFAVLKVYCPLCLTADAAVVGLFIVSGAATSFPMTSLPKRLLGDVKTSFVKPVAIAVIVLFLVGAGSAVALFARETAIAENASATAVAQLASVDRRSEFERWYAAQPRVPLVVPNEGAKVLIVDFSDFQCPYCRQAYVSLKPIIDKYNAVVPNTVRLVLKDFPLDSKCNNGVQNGGPHPFACEAAVAVRLAKAKGREQALEDYLFANQQDFSSENIRKWAREIGQVTDFDAKYPSTIEEVKGDISFGHTLQVGATPTMFINGVKVAGVLAPQYLDQAIAIELQRADAQK